MTLSITKFGYYGSRILNKTVSSSSQNLLDERSDIGDCIADKPFMHFDWIFFGSSSAENFWKGNVLVDMAGKFRKPCEKFSKNIPTDHFIRNLSILQRFTYYFP